MTDVAASPALDFIAKTVADHAVVLFMKGVPDAPRCGFSAVSVQILDHLGVEFIGVDVLQDDDLRQGVDLRAREELCLVADEVVDPCAVSQRVDRVAPEVELGRDLCRLVRKAQAGRHPGRP
jgi:hypothetical protein